ncbi:MAG: hypothetical protein DYG93_04040 [Leptolyngbya sp. PLA2]|nr:hypothetical protein [Leptolyngbya sp.]MCE7970825.1 hypothetical protein [Leptolyngbya sp. PL-A2]MCQ3939980.1 hypothetical protein [cyanobacterium CYA1]MCZ7633607.1 hypothetical protein [Phycisphaerales bacterium]MDL1903275.1 hypothetical protein [Synechococcales cyanobacterium CNB]GIK17969.1 MAG: hypothetical protein BroJett004_01330 [Planctomycetota bacterium]
MRHHHEHDSHAVHPSLRPVEPEHPMSLEGGVVFGDTGLMLRCLVEELLMTGLTPEELRRMARDGEYQGLHAALCAMGPARVESVIAEAASRVGTCTLRVVERHDRFTPADLTIHATTGKPTEHHSRQGA